MEPYEQLMGEQFVQRVALAATLEQRANTAVLAQTPGTQLRDRLIKIPFGEDAFAAASFQLGAAINSMRGLELMTIRVVRQGLASDMQIDASVTVNAAAGLLRQAVECATWACWLLEPEDPGEITVRGFAAAWLNGLEALKHAKALNGPDLIATGNAMNQLVVDGQALELLRKDSGSAPPWAPRRAMQDLSGILRRIQITDLHDVEVGAVLGPGAANGEWVYRWLSGMAHGHSWVHSTEVADGAAGQVGFVSTTVDWFRMSVSASLATQLIHSAIMRLETA